MTNRKEHSEYAETAVLPVHLRPDRVEAVENNPAPPVGVSCSMPQPCDAWIAFHEFTPALRPRRSAWPSIVFASALPTVQSLQVSASFVPSSFVPVMMSCCNC